MRLYHLALVGLLGLLLLLAACKGETAPLTGAAGADVPAPDTAPAPVREAREPAGAPSLPVILIEEVQILGREGFDPAEMTISAGDTIIWINKDPQQKVVVLVFQNEATRMSFNSESIRPGETYSYLFEEPGSYAYWTTAYGVRGRVIVE